MRTVLSLFGLLLILLSGLAVRPVFAGGHTYSDAGYLQSANQFSPGQTVYVKIITTNNGSQEKTFRLLDAAKNPVLTFYPSRQGDGYTGSFPAPASGGVYYLDIRLVDGGAVFAAQENLNVGQANGSGASAEVSINTSVNSGAKSETIIQTEISPSAPVTGRPTNFTSPTAFQPSPSPVPSATVSGRESPPLIPTPAPLYTDFWTRFTSLFHNLYTKLTNLL